MKKTLELEEDVAARLDSAARATGQSVDKVLNDAVREGLEKVLTRVPVRSKPFRQKTRRMGVYSDIDYSKSSALLDELEMEDFLPSARGKNDSR